MHQVSGFVVPKCVVSEELIVLGWPLPYCDPECAVDHLHSVVFSFSL